MANSKKASSPLYEALVAELVDSVDELSQGSLFGMPCLKSKTKAVLGSFDGGVVFKLFGTCHTEALSLAGSMLFDPSGKGRPMKDWVVVTAEHQTEWGRFATAAIAGP